MTRSVITLTGAIVFAGALALHGQETSVKSKTTVKGPAAKTVTYTGCVQTGTETTTYVLNNVVPVSRTTERIGTGGEVTTTTYALVPGEKIELQRHVGHKVEVTGIMIPAGEVKTKAKSEIERENAPNIKVKEETKSKSDMPRFRVVSVKHLAETCTP